MRLATPSEPRPRPPKREPAPIDPARAPSFSARASLALLSRSALRARRKGLSVFAAAAILAHLMAVGAIVGLPAALALLHGARATKPQPPGQATVELVMQDTPSVGGSKPASPAPPQAKTAPKPAQTAAQPTPTPLSSANSTDTVAAPATASPSPKPTPTPQQQSPATTTASAQATEVNLDPYNPPGTGIVSGDNVVPASPDDAHKNVPPSYPIEAERRGEEGAVGLIVTVAPDGHAADVQIASSSGYKVLDDEARRAVSRWHFRPEIRDGQPVSSVFNEQIDFDGSGRER